MASAVAKWVWMYGIRSPWYQQQGYPQTESRWLSSQHPFTPPDRDAELSALYTPTTDLYGRTERLFDHLWFCEWDEARRAFGAWRRFSG